MKENLRPPEESYVKINFDTVIDKQQKKSYTGIVIRNSSMQVLKTKVHFNRHILLRGFTSARLVQSFPRHDTIKLEEGIFIQCQQHVRLIVEGYELTGFLDRTLSAPLRYVSSPKGSLVPNLDDSMFIQLDRLLAYCSLRFTHHFCPLLQRLVRRMMCRLPPLVLLLSSLASGSWISEAKKVEIVLAGLPPKFDAILTLALFSLVPLPLQQLVDVLLEYENCQMCTVQDVPLHANLLENVSFVTSPRELCSRWYVFVWRLQSRFSNQYTMPNLQWVWSLSPGVFFCFNREYDGPSSGARASVLANRHGLGVSVPSLVFGQHHGSTSMALMYSLLRGNVWFSATPLVNQNNRVSNPLFQSSAGQFDCGPQFGLGCPMYNAPRCTSGGAYMPIGPGHFDRPATHRPMGMSLLMEFGASLGHEQARQAMGNGNVSRSSIPWRTKPRVHVYTGSDPCIGLLRLPDLHFFDVSDSTKSQVNATKFGSKFEYTESYILMPVKTTTWYPDSGATHHVCCDASTLHDSTPY
ncbi:hypothetical protein Goshw_008383 [Gossypium schwendimanii]|uniref:Uncharacterized protein n=1 Tax=Gossypium schwendimanii TaxID=34291 RepID=A0A7J9MZD0_GOSSC|nr:hypothetical protein [Gossypium schwendimanii]